MDYIQFIVKMFIGFVVIIVMFRFLGKKELSQMQPLDMVYVMAIADFFSSGITDTEIDWKKTIIHITYMGYIYLYIRIHHSS